MANVVEEIKAEELVDIRTVSVDMDLPKEERISEFVRQIRKMFVRQ